MGSTKPTQTSKKPKSSSRYLSDVVQAKFTMGQLTTHHEKKRQAAVKLNSKCIHSTFHAGKHQNILPALIPASLLIYQSVLRCKSRNGIFLQSRLKNFLFHFLRKTLTRQNGGMTAGTTRTTKRKLPLAASLHGR